MRPLAIAVSVVVLSAFQPAADPADEFSGLIKSYLGMGLPADWDGLEKLPNFKWAPLPPTVIFGASGYVGSPVVVSQTQYVFVPTNRFVGTNVTTVRIPVQDIPAGERNILIGNSDIVP